MNFKSIVGVLLVSSLAICSAADLNLRVENSAGEAVSHVRVQALGSKRNYFTSQYGSVTIKHILTDSIRVRLSHIGYRFVDTTLRHIGAEVLTIRLVDTAISAENVIVTATRSARAMDELPIPAEILTSKEIATHGNNTLTSVLTDQAGIQVVGVVGRGSGVQLQGLDPEYTLILINGNPTIGRTSGVVNLDRFVSQNIEKIEIVKGPNSSQYGSNALAGVINIVTKKPSEGLAGSVGAKLASFRTGNVDASLLYADKGGLYSISLFGSAMRTDGFKHVFSENQISEQPENSAYTTTADFVWYPTKRSELTAGARYNTALYDYYFTNSDGANTHEDGKIWDANASLAFKHKLSTETSIEAKTYFAKYKSYYEDTDRESGTFLSDYSFVESIVRAELLANTTVLPDHNLTLGGGYSREGSESASIDKGESTTNLGYAYLQDDWYPFRHLNLIGSVRYDVHEDFSDNLSPKLALACNPWEWFTFRASVGSGFKAPTAEQLYLDWSNPTSGYSVFGVANIRSAIKKLEERGELSSGDVDFSKIRMLTPEHSLSFDFGWSLRAGTWLEMRTNFFFNEIRDMILYQPIAQKKSGGNVWTYFNLNSVFTRGIEAKVKFSVGNEEISLPRWLRLALDINYQYLVTGDNEKLDSIRSGHVGYVDGNGRYHKTTESEYGGLVGRAAHSGLCRLGMELPEQGITFALRANFRSRYGYFDSNGNGVIDEGKEYAPGYVLLNATLNKKFAGGLTASAGIDNIGDYNDYRMMATNPGRTVFVGIKYDF